MAKKTIKTENKQPVANYDQSTNFEVANCDLKTESYDPASGFEVANCDLKFATSSDVSRNMNLSGKRSIFRFTCSFNRLVGTS